MNNLSYSCKIRYKNDNSCNYIDAKSAKLEYAVKDTEVFSIGKLVNVELTNKSGDDFCGVIHFCVSRPVSKAEFFMPGYMYGNNTADMPNHGRKEFPRITTDKSERAESDYWMCRSDRLAEPISVIFDSNRVFGIAASPYWVGTDEDKCAVNLQESENKTFYKFGGFSCHLCKDGTAGVGYTLGYENAPYLFVQSFDVREREELSEKHCFKLKKNETVSFTMRIYDYAAESEIDINKAFIDAYNTYHVSPRSIDMDVKKAVNCLASAIRDYAWLEDENMYTGFVYDTKPFTYNKIGSLTWTNGLAVATPMLCAANRLSDAKMRKQALSFISNVLQNSYNSSSHLLYDAVEDGKWSVRGWWYSGMHSGGHSAYLNGQAVYYILKAYLSEKELNNTVHTDWIDFVKPVIDKFNQVKNTENEYPFSMSENTGAGIEYDSLGGAWCLTATLLYCQITGDMSYFEEAVKSEQHYYDKFVKKMVCYGGPLDTDKAVDNEGILAYVRAAKILHDISGNSVYLEHLRDGLYYEVSFKLAYNTPVFVNPLQSIGWSSCGGSITSVANPHIHPMSSTVIDELIYCVENTGDEYLKSRLGDTIAWGLQTFNTYDKEYGYGYVGWMSERFCFCEGLLAEKYPDGTLASTWFALMPWASASVIEGFVGKCWDNY